jgi:hypothetical protein
VAQKLALSWLIFRQSKSNSILFPPHPEKTGSLEILTSWYLYLSEERAEKYDLLYLFPFFLHIHPIDLVNNKANHPG